MWNFTDKKRDGIPYVLIPCLKQAGWNIVLVTTMQKWYFVCQRWSTLKFINPHKIFWGLISEKWGKVSRNYLFWLCQNSAMGVYLETSKQFFTEYLWTNVGWLCLVVTVSSHHYLLFGCIVFSVSLLYSLTKATKKHSISATGKIKVYD